MFVDMACPYLLDIQKLSKLTLNQYNMSLINANVTVSEWVINTVDVTNLLKYVKTRLISCQQIQTAMISAHPKY